MDDDRDPRAAKVLGRQGMMVPTISRGERLATELLIANFEPKPRQGGLFD